MRVTFGLDTGDTDRISSFDLAKMVYNTCVNIGLNAKTVANMILLEANTDRKETEDRE